MPEFESRRLTDAAELRAMAHPLRMRLIEELGLDGPLTATELADRVGESPSNLSWHLRQLAKHGYVEEVPFSGRKRPWRLASYSHSFGDLDDADARAAAAALGAIVERHEMDSRQEYRAREQAESKQWRDAAFSSSYVAWMTPEELADFNTVINEALAPFFDRLTDASVRPAGARPVRFVGWAHPLRAPERDLP